MILGWVRPIIFVILTCFIGQEKISVLPSKNKVANEKKLVQCGKFSSTTLFLEFSELNFSYQKFRQQSELKPEKERKLICMYQNLVV